MRQAEDEAEQRAERWLAAHPRAEELGKIAYETGEGAQHRRPWNETSAANRLAWARGASSCRR
jgi:hypothetical protein